MDESTVKKLERLTKKELVEIIGKQSDELEALQAEKAIRLVKVDLEHQIALARKRRKINER